MKVLIYLTDVIGVHFRTDLELAVDHLDRGDEVHLVTCHGDLRICPSNPGHDLATCFECKSKLKRGLKAESVEGAQQHVLNLEDDLRDVDVPEFGSIAELKAFTYDGVNLGMPAASSIISGLREPVPDISEHRDYVVRSLGTAVAVYRAMLRFLERLDPDVLYVLNGRRAPQMPAVRAAQKSDVKVYCYEVGHHVDKYTLMEDTYFHDLEAIKRDIDRYWEREESSAERRELAKEFYRERRYGSGDVFLEAQYKEAQAAGKLPDGFDEDRRNIAVFSSSEDEFAAVEGYDNPVYADQHEALERLVRDPRLDDRIHFYLRVHPNLANLDNTQTEKVEELEEGNLTIIPATADIDTYGLMEACEKTLGFGTTMSIESAFAGKPSILIGRAWFEDLGSCYRPASHDEAVALLNDPNLEPLDREGAIKFGYYMLARDREYEHVDTTSDSLDGVALRPHWFAESAWKSSLRKDVVVFLERLRQGESLRSLAAEAFWSLVARLSPGTG